MIGIPEYGCNGRFRSVLFGAAIVLLFATSRALALNPHKLISQYAHSVWTIQDGSLPGSPAVLAQTSDGYLWIGTEAGLVRFDGEHFVRWNGPGGNDFSSSAIDALMASADGSLWIADSNGPNGNHVRHWAQGHLTTYDEGDSLPTAFAETKDGAVWFLKSATLGEAGGALCRIAEGQTQCFGKNDGLLFKQATALDFDSHGNAWIVAPDKLIRWTGSSSTVYQPAALKSYSGREVFAAINAPDGSLYAGFAIPGPGLGLEHFVQGRWEAVRAHNFLGSRLKVVALLLDRQNALWVGTFDEGIYRIYGDAIDHFSTADGLSSNFVQDIHEDAEGTIWVATARGVDNFRDMPVAGYSTKNGLCTEQPDAVVAMRDGTVWVGGAEGLCSLRNGVFTSIVPGKGLPGHQVTAMMEDHAGRLWMGVDEKLYIDKRGKLVEIRSATGDSVGFVKALTEDIDRNVWAVTSRPARELLRIHEEKAMEIVRAPEISAAFSLAADRRGGIWIGLLTGDLARFQDGHLRIFRYPHHAEGAVFDVYVDSDDSVYGATPFGVIGWRSGKQEILSAANGLPCSQIYNVVSDRSDNLWLYSSCGLMRVAHSDVERWWRDPHTLVQPQVLSALDGAWPSPVPFETSQRATDGRLLFVNSHELQTIDPAHVPSNPNPPPVHVEDVVVDQKRYAASGELRLPARVRNLEIDYTALSFVIPQRVRFRYRLDGHDTDWQDAGTRREAFYTDLSPRRYRFHVIACNNDGVWNTAGATVEFSIAAAWYQTKWFHATCVLLALLTIWVIYRLRVSQIAAAMRLRFNERLEERTRMARELHDTFLQTVQGSRMVVEDALDSGADSTKMEHALQKLTIWLTQAVDEGRAALHALRISTMERNHLSEALKRATEDPLIPPTMNISFTMIGDAWDLHPIVRDEIYRIGFEAIRNAALHSRASRLQVEVRYAHDLSVTVTDDGVGIDPSISDHGKAGHFGLQGMRERAARIRGKLSIRSSVNMGTEVVLVVPGTVAYRSVPPSLIRSIWERLHKFVRYRSL